MKKILSIIIGVLFVVSALLTAWCIFASSNDASLHQATSVILIWSYILFVLALGVTIFCAIFGVVKHPAGMKSALASVGIIVVVVVIALVFALSHKGMTIPNSGGGVFDNRAELVLTESSIIVAYIGFAVAILAAVYSEIHNALK